MPQSQTASLSAGIYGGSTMSKHLALAAFIAAVAFSPASAFAAFVVSVTGTGALVSPPADSSPGAFEANSFSVWEESTGEIASDLALDHDGTAGDFQGNDDFSLLGTTLSAGTKYNATLIHLDPESQGLGSAKAAISFATQIIGIALFGTAVDASDIYGAPGTTYPTGAVPTVSLDTRGIDFRANDKFSISADGKILSLHFTGNGAGFDQIRVFTAAGAVPEPASLAVWTIIGTAVGGRSWWRRRKVAR
jgi:hypothetical protein